MVCVVFIPLEDHKKRLPVHQQEDERTALVTKSLSKEDRGPTTGCRGCG